jgi:5-hydroxyisourate hydrolase
MITTHVLDLGRGRPAAGISVTLELRQRSEWTAVGSGVTDQNGRLATLTEDFTIVPGTYRLAFDVGGYHRDHGAAAPFFPEANITFDVRDAREHYHVPLLLSPFGYSTYRGS